VGFYPQSRQYIEARMNKVPSVLNATPAYSLEHVRDMNQRVAKYIEWWDLFDICIQVCSRVLLKLLNGYFMSHILIKRIH